MKSIKPGRGPSMMGGIMGIFAALFGVFWTIMAISMRAPFFMAIFGVGFVIISVIQAVYNFKNATSKNRYSAFDIVDQREETDPWNEKFGSNSAAFQADDVANFCPYCGNPVDSDHSFCSKCGKSLS